MWMKDGLEKTNPTASYIGHVGVHDAFGNYYPDGPMMTAHSVHGILAEQGSKQVQHFHSFGAANTVYVVIDGLS